MPVLDPVAKNVHEDRPFDSAALRAASLMASHLSPSPGTGARRLTIQLDCKMMGTMNAERPEQGSSVSGERRDFPSTCWSRILSSTWKDGLRDPAAMEDLAARYWRPIYAYVRVGWARTHEDAKDLTQDFFVWMMESDFLSKADPGRGRFRAFVQVALKHYLSKDDRDARRLKRGGAGKTLTLGEIAEWGVADPAGGTPEETLDRAWKRELLARATAQLEAECRTEGKETAFRIFREFHLSGGAAEDSYRDVAERHGLSEVAVQNHLARTKDRFRAILTGLVRETVADPVALEEELRFLFGGGGS